MFPYKIKNPHSGTVNWPTWVVTPRATRPVYFSGISIACCHYWPLWGTHSAITTPRESFCRQSETLSTRVSHTSPARHVSLCHSKKPVPVSPRDAALLSSVTPPKQLCEALRQSLSPVATPGGGVSPDCVHYGESLSCLLYVWWITGLSLHCLYIVSMLGCHSI